MEGGEVDYSAGAFWGIFAMTLIRCDDFAVVSRNNYYAAALSTEKLNDRYSRV